ncbi:MAG TPA: allantoate amidohydrolase [Nocardioidaceae bacterium]|nr:allantoate amidohydrolase [Nocardioidaceae bacterium]
MSHADFTQMWQDLLPIGRSSRTGGYFRQPFASAEREMASWFLEQGRARDLEVQTDPVGNVVAWWGGPPAAGGPKAVLTGSHLDSVLDGGAYDGPLGVVSALAAVDVLRDRGFVPTRPIGIGVFVEEEGSRFGLACLGSRLATGAIAWGEAAALTDPDGVRLDEALTAVGLPPDPAHVVWTELTDRIGCFVELHVEQGRDLVDRDAPVGVASAIWPHGRYRFDFTGEANHAGTTRMEDRRDPMLTYAMTALAATEEARLSGQRATFGRLDVHPNGTNAVPSRVTAWLDARAESAEVLATLVDQVERMAGERAGRDGTTVVLTAESVSPAVVFDPELAARIAEQDKGDWPVIPTMAGHDAGILSAAGVPTAMLFVRNPTGVSHSPAEHAETADCLAGVDALATTLERMAGA